LTRRTALAAAKEASNPDRDVGRLVRGKKVQGRKGAKKKWVKRAEKGRRKGTQGRGDERIDDQAPAHKSSKHLLKGG
jgi:hypothetical protein